jgi:hypothetical protein
MLHPDRVGHGPLMHGLAVILIEAAHDHPLRRFRALRP